MTDNARGLSMEVRDICEPDGIKFHMTVPYHPASNGVAEHTDGIRTNAVQAMLRDSGLPDFLWAEAFNTATYVRVQQDANVPARSTRSGLSHDGEGGSGETMLTIDQPGYPPVAFSAGFSWRHTAIEAA